VTADKTPINWLFGVIIQRDTDTDGNAVWSNGLKKYKTMVENVQRKFTKHIKGLRDTPYENRLQLIKLPSLEYRQLRGDMIQVFKIANNFYVPITTT